MKGELYIGLSKSDNDIIDLQITDNGKGIPADLDLRKSSSTGLSLMFILAEQQLNCEVNYQSQNGLQWQIRLKNDFSRTRV
jgi:two-component sensor histidine kinase